MKTVRQAKRNARHLFELCFENGLLDEDRVRRVIGSILRSKRRGYFLLANQFGRLVRLERLRRTAEVQSALSLSSDLRSEIEASLTGKYGTGIEISFAERPELIGGMRVRVGSDIYDGSIKAELEALTRRF